MDKVNLARAFEAFSEHWSPRIVAQLNDSYVKVAKLKGDFIWHRHDNEDELFLVVRGSLLLQFRDGVQQVEAGELIVVPRGVEHRPVAEDEVQVLLVEPKTTVNTGAVRNERTVESEWLR